MPDPDLSLTEWAVLGVLATAPAHGFAVARQLQAPAPVGRVWTVPRPLVYRAIGRLEDQALIHPRATEPGAGGPQRTVYRIGRRGRAALDRWLRTPVDHLRDVRSELLLKLVLCARHGVEPRQLVESQQEVFRGHLAALDVPAGRPVDPVDLWRHESAQAVARFLGGLLVTQ
ncbi:MAG: PadR family transcriptional regulator [Acidimicrobiia bacterium]